MNDPDVDWIRDEAEQEIGSRLNQQRGMCPVCHYSLALHDASDPEYWGCPSSEAEAVERWGR